MPRNVIVVLLDSLNRHLLGCYGGTEFDTPTIDRLAARGLRFTNHVAGSLPCMPARHDILVGALDFLWRPWGSIEIWEDAVTYPHAVVPASPRCSCRTTRTCSRPAARTTTATSRRGTTCAATRTIRGARDPIRRGSARPRSTRRPAPWRRGYDIARTYFRDESRLPGTAHDARRRRLARTARWNHPNATRSDDRFFLLVDEFDPHEPFDTPAPWASRYDDPSDPWNDPLLIWPPYARTTDEAGLTDREARHVRANYGAKLSMIDSWLGRLDRRGRRTRRCGTTRP